MWFDEDPANDPTVYSTVASVWVGVGGRDPDGTEHPLTKTLIPATSVRLDRDALVVHFHGGDWTRRFPLADIRFAEIKVVSPPELYDYFRGLYSNAFEPWRAADVEQILAWGRQRGEPLDDLAERLGRPPRHIEEKLQRLRDLERKARAAVPMPLDPHGRRLEPAPYHRHPPRSRIHGVYLVSIRDGVDPADVAARYGVRPAGCMSWVRCSRRR